MFLKKSAMKLLAIYLQISAFSCFILCVLVSSVDHSLFLKQIHLKELGIQINRMHEKLYEHCPKYFQNPNIESIIGRRSTVYSSLDLKIELAEKTLEYLIQEFGNCTSSSPATTPQASTKPHIPTTPNTITIQPMFTSTYAYPHTTTASSRHAFQVLRSQNVSRLGYDFLVLEVLVPRNGLSKSANWCYDYQYLCEDFRRRPTGCGTVWIKRPTYVECRDKYNSDMNIGYALGCNPSDGVAALANTVFPNLCPPANITNSFGFHECVYCNNTIQGSRLALTYMDDFRLSNKTTFYTVCR